MHNTAYMSREELEALGFASLGDDVRIHPSCVLVGCEKISLGSHVRIDPFCLISPSAGLVIGSHVHVAAHVAIVGAGEISVGDFASLSFGSKLLSSTDHFSAGVIAGPMVAPEHRGVINAQIVVGKHVIVGANAVVLPGVKLGEGATVGALSLVKRDLDPWTVNAGAPTRVIGVRDREGVLAHERAIWGQV
jgi:galactoside O-acetyltransferase